MNSRSSFKTLSVIGLALLGCGQPTAPTITSTNVSQAQPTAQASNQEEKPVVENAKQAGDSSTERTRAHVDQNASTKSEIDGAPSGDTNTNFPAKAASPLLSSSQSSAATATPSSTTATEAIAAIDLLALPRLNEKRLLESCSTYVYYSAEGTLPSADAFYKAEFASRGWKELSSESPATDSYVDRSFGKNGYVVRISLSTGSTQGELGVMLSNLGNVDVRKLPQMPDADVAGIPSTAVNATHKTAKSIPEVADTLSKKLLELEWQPYGEFHETPMDVPHYRSLKFRKEAARINLGIVKNPQNPAEKTTVFYHAEYVMPFDVPTRDSKQALKLDLISNRAAFEFGSSRQELVAMLELAAKKYGWDLSKAAEFAKGDVHAVAIETKNKQYLLARLVESAGKYSVSIDKSIQPAEKTSAPAPEAVVKTESSDSKPAKQTEIESEIEKLQAQAESQIQAELNQALGALKGISSGGKMNLADLQAQADRINKSMEKLNDFEAESAADSSNQNPFDVPEDKIQLSEADKLIKQSVCTIKLGDKTYQLKNSAAYVVKEYGEATKCLIFSEGQVNAEKLGRLLLKEGRPVHAIDVCDSSKAMINIHIGKNSVSINAIVGSGSFSTNSDEIKSDVKYVGGKLVGRVATARSLEMASQPFDFEVNVSQPVTKIDWTNRNSPENQKLLPDASKDFLIPENAQGYSSEGSKYSKQIDTVVESPIKLVQQFYDENLSKQGWKVVSQPKSNSVKYQLKDQDLELRLAQEGTSTKISMNIRNQTAAKADGMLPPPGKSLLVLGNMSQSAIQVTIAGKSYTVKPSDGSDPKDAPKVVVDHGTTKIQFRSSDGKSSNLEARTETGSTWGVIFDDSFQDTMRLF